LRIGSRSEEGRGRGGEGGVEVDREREEGVQLKRFFERTRAAKRIGEEGEYRDQYTARERGKDVRVGSNLYYGRVDERGKKAKRQERRKGDSKISLQRTAAAPPSSRLSSIFPSLCFAISKREPFSLRVTGSNK